MQLKRRYQVRPMGPADVERKLVKYHEDKKTKKAVSEIVTEKVHYPETFIVMFPRGHSIRVLNRARLHEMGLAEEAQVVDMETGLPPPGSHDLHDFTPIYGSLSSGDPLQDALGDALRG